MDFQIGKSLSFQDLLDDFVGYATGSRRKQAWYCLLDSERLAADAEL